ncbi:hypothetical protein KKF34_14630 [Myxococcota bacterium]|nr:hypothetical protein [Myxococcota bacterium]MBU1382108.1 hypothetical protein [Myxococcota bacterium]MBU1498110.1 hypothetical protein [Myxococcota bacterium]
MDFDELKKISESRNSEGIYLVTVKKGKVKVSDVNEVEIIVKSFEKRSNTLTNLVFAVCGLLLISLLITVNTPLIKYIPQISFLKGVFAGIGVSVALFIIFGLVTDFISSAKLQNMKDEFASDLSRLGVDTQWLLSQDWLEKKYSTVFNALSKGFPEK